jgi:lipoprotein-releasing system permease protein
LNLPYFLAQKIAQNKQASFSKFILRLATIATTISVAVMIVAICVVQGFKTKIRDKMFVFWGHAQITLFNANPTNLIGDAPFKKDENLLRSIQSHEGVASVHPYILKPTIVKAESALEGLKLKGIDAQYPLSTNDAISFSGKPIAFNPSSPSLQIILSETTLARLALQVGDDVQLVFFKEEQSAPSIRKVKVVGTYHTGIEDVDKNFALCDISLLRQINGWLANDISALQVNVKDYRNAEQVSNSIYKSLIQPPLSIATVQDIYPYLFSWLSFQDVNAALVLIIMAVVAAINMATSLLIYILERTTMVGTLKALGMTNKAIQRVFLYHAARVALRGIFWGTLIGVLLCWIQSRFQLLSLDEEIYYMKAAPIAFNWAYILLVDLATLLFCILIMTLPALIVRKIKIVNALKFK